MVHLNKNGEGVDLFRRGNRCVWSGHILPDCIHYPETHVDTQFNVLTAIHSLQLMHTLLSNAVQFENQGNKQQADRM